MAKSCEVCGKRAYSDRCTYHKIRKPIKQNKPLPRATKPIKKQSAKEKDYQVYKETVLRPALIERDGNYCNHCRVPCAEGQKLDIDHIINKGSRPDLKEDLDNLQLLCRKCHYKKTNHLR